MNTRAELHTKSGYRITAEKKQATEPQTVVTILEENTKTRFRFELTKHDIETLKQNTVEALEATRRGEHVWKSTYPQNNRRASIAIGTVNHKPVLTIIVRTRSGTGILAMAELTLRELEKLTRLMCNTYRRTW